MDARRRFRGPGNLHGGNARQPSPPPSTPAKRRFSCLHKTKPSLHFLHSALGKAAPFKEEPKSFSQVRDQQRVLCPPQPPPEQSPPSDLQKALTVVLAVSPAEPRHGPSGERQRKMWQGSERRERAGQAREGAEAAASLGRVRPPPPGRYRAVKPRGQGANDLARQGTAACRKAAAPLRATRGGGAELGPGAGV